MAGSLGLNKRFEQAVKKLVGDFEFAKLQKTKAFEQAMQQFDRHIKTAFRSDQDDDYYVNFPMASLNDNVAKNLQSNCWAMTAYVLEIMQPNYELTFISREVKDIFEPLIEDILRMVDEQVKPVKQKRTLEYHERADQIKVSAYVEE